MNFFVWLDMQQFPAPNSILVMVNEVRAEVDSAGIMVIYLPPYSPDFNPCEELFSYIKYYLKDHNLIFGCMDEPLEILKSGFNSVTV